MSLLNKLSIAMARIGCSGLRNASEQHKDDLNYVKAVIKAQGPRSFQFASDYIRSDAKSLIEMVAVNSEILRYTKAEIYDRYVKDIEIVEDELVDELTFALKCLKVNVNSIIYFDQKLQNKVVEAIQNQDVYNGKFAGKPCAIDLTNLKTDKDLWYTIDCINSHNDFYA